MDPENLLIAIDPGKNGALAVFGRQEGTWSWLTVADPGDQGLAPVLHVVVSPSCEVVIEQVHGLPRQSGPGSFNFGKGYGELLGVCLAHGIVPHLVPPAVWKTALRLGRDKSLALEMARELYPGHVDLFRFKKHDGRAEAVLLGHYWLHRRLA